VRPGFKRTEVGDIPDDWDCPFLDSVASRASGHTPDKAHPEYWNGSVAWISLQDSHRLDKPRINDTSATITEAGLRNSSARLLPAGTVVLSRDAGVGRSSIMARSMAVSQHFMAWTCGRRLCNSFLYYWLQRSKPEFERIAIGNTIKTIGLPYFRALRIPLPERAEQDSIAEVLGDTDALLASLEQLLAKKRAIRQGAMQSLLTAAKRLPGFGAPWTPTRLGDVATLRIGRTPPRSDPRCWGSAYPWLTIADLTSKHVSSAAEQITEFGALLTFVWAPEGNEQIRAVA
jgi:type I restriction enzyme S subunit